MLQVVVSLVVLIVSISVILNFNNSKKQILMVRKQDIEILKQCAHKSIAASNTVDPITALVDVSKAIQSIENLHTRYGPSNANQLNSFDTVEMLEILQIQHQNILNNIMNQYPNLKKPHPFNEIINKTF